MFKTQKLRKVATWWFFRNLFLPAFFISCQVFGHFFKYSGVVKNILPGPPIKIKDYTSKIRTKGTQGNLGRMGKIFITFITHWISP